MAARRRVEVDLGPRELLVAHDVGDRRRPLAGERAQHALEVADAHVVALEREVVAAEPPLRDRQVAPRGGERLRGVEALVGAAPVGLERPHLGRVAAPALALDAAGEVARARDVHLHAEQLPGGPGHDLRRAPRRPRRRRPSARPRGRRSPGRRAPRRGRGRRPRRGPPPRRRRASRAVRRAVAAAPPGEKRYRTFALPARGPALEVRLAVVGPGERVLDLRGRLALLGPGRGRHDGHVRGRAARRGRAATRGRRGRAGRSRTRRSGRAQRTAAAAAGRLSARAARAVGQAREGSCAPASALHTGPLADPSGVSFTPPRAPAPAAAASRGRAAHLRGRPPALGPRGHGGRPLRAARPARRRRAACARPAGG